MLRPGAGRALEQPCGRDLQHVTDAGEPRGADAIDSLFVLLHLLERHADPVAEFGLTDAKQIPPEAYSRPDIGVDGLRILCSQGGGHRLAPRPGRRWVCARQTGMKE